ncbi:MAG TPA: hypothetical protein VML96_12815, partial [Egibacteraceae bacterium]|nr:hypothetical protein [Egibacteraceae bacterium]
SMELASLISAARWALHGAEGELPREAAEQLRQVLASYDQQVARLDDRSGPAGRAAQERP